MSMIREMIVSTQPPKKPASMPSTPPMSVMPSGGEDRDRQRRPRAVDGVRVVVAAQDVRAEQCSALGAELAIARDRQSRGSLLVHSFGKTAIDATMRMIATESEEDGVAEQLAPGVRPQARAALLAWAAGPAGCGRSRLSGTATPGAATEVSGNGSLIADPRVEHGVEQVHQQVHDQIDQHEHGHDADDDSRLALAMRSRTSGYPTPGTLKIVSVTTAPPMSHRWTARGWSPPGSASCAACARRPRASCVRPLALAVRT